MLRSGYSSAAVMKELASRHFSDQFDADAEAQIQKAGASLALLQALRDGTYAASPAEIAAAQKEQAARVDRESFARESAQNSDALKGPANQPPDTPASTKAPSPEQIYQMLKDSLVIRQRGVLVPVDEETLRKKKLFLFFFSAISSPLGRHFTSRLSEYYQQVEIEHPEIEVIFFSGDRSQFAMENYMSQTEMPWPAVAFSEIGKQFAALPAGFVHDLPTLALVDASGKVLSRSADPSPAALEKVLVDLDKTLQNGSVGTR